MVTAIIYPYVGNGPGSRFALGYWIDNKNQFWIFGGQGFDSAGTNGNGSFDRENLVGWRRKVAPTRGKRTRLCAVPRS